MSSHASPAAALRIGVEPLTIMPDWLSVVVVEEMAFLICVPGPLVLINLLPQFLDSVQMRPHRFSGIRLTR